MSKELDDWMAWWYAGKPDGDPRRDALVGASMRDSELDNTDFRGAILRGADLGGADLGDADLSGADLRGANLGGAGMTHADLSHADLSGADLSGADLRGAYLYCAKLYGVNLRGAHIDTCLDEAHGIATARHVGRWLRTIYAVDHRDRIMVQFDCCWDTSDAMIAAIETDYANDPAMRDAYIEAIREMVATLEAAR